MTNREAFNQHIREELNRQAEAWEQADNKTLLKWTTGVHRDAHIEVKVGRELCYFKMDKTHSTSVGSMQDVLEWLEQEVEQDDE